MKNFVQAGTTLTLPAPYDLASGMGFRVGALFAVACGDAAAGAEVEGVTGGVFMLPKTEAQVWSVGTRIYWDDVSRRCDSDAPKSNLIGVAMIHAASTSTVGLVRLNGGAVGLASAANVVPTVVSAPIINGTPTAGAVVSSVGAGFSGTPAPTVVTTWQIDGVRVASGVPYSVPADGGGKSLVRRDTATNSAGSVYSDSAPVVIGAAAPSVPHLFVRPASGVTYQGALFTNGGNLTKYDSQSAYRAMTAQSEVVIRLTNVTKINGDGQEVVSTTPLRMYAVAEWLNDAGNAAVFNKALHSGSDNVVFPANVATIKDVVVSGVTFPTDRNFVVHVRIEHEDGVSQIVVPVGTASDYSGAVLGSRGTEGHVLNSATNLSTTSAGAAPWAGRIGAQQYRPLAIFALDGPKVRAAVVLGDSISSPADSAVSRILNLAGIPNVNIGSGGESQDNWSADNAVRATVLPLAKTLLLALGRNGNGAGRGAALTKLQAVMSKARADGIERIIYLTQGPQTSAASVNPSPLTVEGQNPEGSSVRINVNQDMRDLVGQANGPDRIWDIEKIICTPDRLKFRDGFSSDYLHWTSAANAAVVEVAVAENWQADII